MRRNGHKTRPTAGVKFDPKFEFSVPDFLYGEKFLEIGPRFHVGLLLADFLLRMRRNGQNSTSDQILKPKFETHMGCFLFYYGFWWRLLQDLCVFKPKNGFCNAQF